MKRFANYPTFRTTLASHIREVQGGDFTLWSPLALRDTYPAAIDILRKHSSWRDWKVTIV